MWKLILVLLTVGMVEGAVHAHGALGEMGVPLAQNGKKDSAPAATAAIPKSSAEFLNTQAMAEAPQAAVQNLTGLDLSKWQGTVNFPDLVQRKMAFVFLKATEGANVQDPTYRNNVFQARQNKIPVGSYHFYDSNIPPDQQLQNFFQFADIRSGDLPPVIDVETIAKSTSQALKSSFLDDVKSFARGINEKYKVKPIIYTNRSFSNSNNLHTALADYPLWIADWNVKTPVLPQGWNNWLFWQYTDSGSVSGVNGKIDLNMFNGDADALAGVLIP